LTEARLRILQVSSSDSGGGANLVAAALTSGLNALGQEASLAVGMRSRESNPVVVQIPRTLPGSRWRRLWEGTAATLEKRLPAAISDLPAKAARLVAHPGPYLYWRLGLEYYGFPGTRKLLELSRERPDLLHAHNLHGGYFDLRALPWLTHQVPTVLTLHDAWLLSGHCCHSFECERWRTGCGRCPDLKVYPEVRRDATAWNWRRKRAIYARSRLNVITPSQWLMDKVKGSMLATAIRDSRVIPNGIDLNVFRPADRLDVRRRLGIETDRPVVLFAAPGIRDNPFKDFGTIRKSVEILSRSLPGKRLLCMALGDDAPPEIVGNAEIRYKQLTAAQDVAACFQAADLYLHAARAETFPMVILEALACGTPVIATSVGGIPEQIEDGRNGFLVPMSDASGMARRALQLLNEPGLSQSFSEESRRAAAERFDVTRQVKTTLEWYHEVLSAWHETDLPRLGSKHQNQVALVPPC
jgi:glycosyltransferase involved in cell wall biosynthesis